MLSIQVYCVADPKALAQGERIIQALTKIEEALVALKDELNQKLSVINDATNSVASAITAAVAEFNSLVQRLQDALNNGNTLSDADKAELEAKADTIAANLTNAATTLQGIAADPANPVPPPAA